MASLPFHPHQAFHCVFLIAGDAIPPATPFTDGAINEPLRSIMITRWSCSTGVSRGSTCSAGLFYECRVATAGRHRARANSNIHCSPYCLDWWRRDAILPIRDKVAGNYDMTALLTRHCVTSVGPIREKNASSVWPRPYIRVILAHMLRNVVANAVITTAIRLRYDYDPTTTYRARLLPIRRKQKMNMSIFRRSRIIVESQLRYRLNRVPNFTIVGQRFSDISPNEFHCPFLAHPAYGDHPFYFIQSFSFLISFSKYSLRSFHLCRNVTRHTRSRVDTHKLSIGIFVAVYMYARLSVSGYANGVEWILPEATQWLCLQLALEIVEMSNFILLRIRRQVDSWGG